MKPATVVPIRLPAREIPAPRDRVSDDPAEGMEPRISKLPVGASDQIRINVNKDLAKNRAAAAAPEPSIPKGDIDDIEDWDPIPDIPPFREAPVPPPVPLVSVTVAPPPVSVTVAPPPPETPPTHVAVTGTADTADASASESQDEFSVVSRTDVAPVSLRPRLGLSAIERIGLILLLLMLLAGGGAILMVALKHLPTDSKRAGGDDFQVKNIKGKYITIQSATSYWREPIMTGEDSDTIRRGTKLLPVLEIKARGGPAAIRVHFHSEEPGLVGDPVTKMVRGEAPVEFPATAGFDDLGMHADYVTGDGKRWIIEVFEAPSETSAGSDFRKLFEMNVSTDRR